MEQTDVLRRVLGALDELGIEHMLVGSLASMVFGEPRLTRDIDIVIRLDESQVEALCNAFPFPEFYVSREAVREAVRFRSQFNIIHPTSGNKVDLMLVRDDEWGKNELARRKKVSVLPGINAYVASPEDLIIAKMLYYQEGEHEKHLRDIAGMIQLSGNLIDMELIRKWSVSLGLSDVWQTVLARVRRP